MKINWKYNIGDRITTNKKIDCVITDRKIVKKKVTSKKDKRGYENSNLKYYEYRCNICGATSLWKPENRITNTSCACCTNRVHICGINTIGDKYPEILKYFENKEDAFDENLKTNSKYAIICPTCNKKHKVLISNLIQGKFYCPYCNSFRTKRPELIKILANSNDADLPAYKQEKVLTQCPDCGFKKEMKLCNLTSQGYTCARCGKNTSYPEKFIFSFLNQLNINYDYQLSRVKFKWCEKYKYDFFIPPSTIIEVNGIQHYEDSFSRLGGATANENKKIDKKKKELALKNGIKNYIILDCRKSNKEWICNSILKSDLNALYDLSKINWNLCDEYATQNSVKKVCEYYNTHLTTSIRDISKIFKMSESGIMKYLKKGEKLGWCDYSTHHNKNSCNKKVYIYKNKELICICDSVAKTVTFLKNEYNIQTFASTISRLCRKKHHYKGFEFYYEKV